MSRKTVYDCLNCLGTGKNFIHPIWNDEPILKLCGDCDGMGYVNKPQLKKQMQKAKGNNLVLLEKIDQNKKKIAVPGKRGKEKG